MDFRELTVVRRSTRNYTEETVDPQILKEILILAQQAPTWKNSQTARCYVVQSPEQLEDFRSAVLPSFNQKSSAHAALIVTTFVKDVSGFTNGEPDTEVGNAWGAYDLGLHDAYLVLAARDAGYDSLIMGIRDAEKIRELLQIPENEVIMSVIAVGKAAQQAQPRPRKDPEEVIRFF